MFMPNFYRDIFIDVQYIYTALIYFSIMYLKIIERCDLQTLSEKFRLRGKFWFPDKI